MHLREVKLLTLGGFLEEATSLCHKERYGKVSDHLSDLNLVSTTLREDEALSHRNSAFSQTVIWLLWGSLSILCYKMVTETHKSL